MVKMNLGVVLVFALFVNMFVVSSSVFAAEDFKSVQVTLLNQNPDPVYAGDVVEISLGLENIGFGLYDDGLVLEIEDSFPFTVVSDRTVEFSSIYSNEDYAQTAKFKLMVDSSAKSGEYNIIVKEYEVGKSSFYREHEVVLEVKANNNIEILSVDKTSILPGGVEEVSFKVKNVGSSNLKNLELYWENSDEVLLPVGQDNVQFIDSLDIGEEVDVKFLISASSLAVADLYKIDLNVEYEDSKGSSTSLKQSSSVGMYVGGESAFDIIFDEVSDNEYVFTILNIGANDASSVKVSLDDSSSFRVSGKASEVVGNLNQGDYTTISFEFSRVQGDLIFDVEYTDTAGKRVNFLEEVEIDVSSNMSQRPNLVNADGEVKGAGRMRDMQSGISSLGSILMNVLYVVAFLVVVFVLFKVYKKRKKN